MKMSTKIMTKIFTFAMLLGLVLGVAGVSKAMAATGPNTGKDCCPYIEAIVGETDGLEFDGIADSMRGYYPPKHDFEGLDYDKATNTLTITNFKADRLDANEMGDDFKIKLVGDSSIGWIQIWGYGYGGSVTFIGDGTLATERLWLNAEQSASGFAVEDSAKITIKRSSALKEDKPTFGIIATTVDEGAMKASCTKGKIDRVVKDVYETGKITIDGYDYTLVIVIYDGMILYYYPSESLNFETGEWELTSIKIYTDMGLQFYEFKTEEEMLAAGYVKNVKGHVYTFETYEDEVVLTAPADTKDSKDTKSTAKVHKKGSKIKYNKDTYKVTKAGSAKKAGTVEFVTSPKTKKTVTIPASFRYDGITYNVTSIAGKAFSGNKKLTTLTIGKNVKTIKKALFYNCSSLKSIKILSTKLTSKSVDKAAFSNVSGTVKYTVPSSKLSAYKVLLVKSGANKKSRIAAAK